MALTTVIDPHAQLRALYMSLLTHQEHFDEFKRLLALYDLRPDELENEPESAAEIRSRLNRRIREWVGAFDGLSAAQTLQWRAIVVEERFNVSLSPWKESNMY
jgi:predicted nucleic acid-binding protein